MLFVTYNAETGALISVTDTPVSTDPTMGVRAVNSDSVDLKTWDPTSRTFHEERAGGETWKITRLAFRTRFTSTEKASMEFAALDNPAASMQARQGAAMLRAYMADVSASTFIDLSRLDTRAGVLQLEAMKLLASGRANEILNRVPTASEVYLAG